MASKSARASRSPRSLRRTRSTLSGAGACVACTGAPSGRPRSRKADVREADLVVREQRVAAEVEHAASLAGPARARSRARGRAAGSRARPPPPRARAMNDHVLRERVDPRSGAAASRPHVRLASNASAISRRYADRDWSDAGRCRTRRVARHPRSECAARRAGREDRVHHHRIDPRRTGAAHGAARRRRRSRPSSRCRPRAPRARERSADPARQRHRDGSSPRRRFWRHAPGRARQAAPRRAPRARTPRRARRPARLAGAAQPGSQRRRGRARSARHANTSASAATRCRCASTHSTRSKALAEQLGDDALRDRLAGLERGVLPHVAEIRRHQRDGRRAGAPQRVGREQQLDELRVRVVERAHQHGRAVGARRRRAPGSHRPGSDAAPPRARPAPAVRAARERAGAHRETRGALVPALQLDVTAGLSRVRRPPHAAAPRARPRAR